MHNKGLGTHTDNVCADTPDKYSSRVMVSDENLRFSSSILRQKKIVGRLISLNDLPGVMGRCSSNSKLCHGHLMACSFLNVSTISKTLG